MALSVRPEGLVSYGQQLDRAANDVNKCRSYIERFAELKTGGDLLNLARSAHERVANSIISRLNQAASLISASSSELNAAADYYRKTDATAANSIDATLPYPYPFIPSASNLETERKNTRRGPIRYYGDPREPTNRLAPISDPDYSHPLGFLDNISISNWANLAISNVFGFDLIAKVTDFCFGDWERLARTGVALANLAAATHDLGFNIQSGRLDLAHDWKGNAGYAAGSYFDVLSNKISDWRKPLEEISKQYEKIGQEVAAAADALGGFIKGILDSAIIAGISFAAGTVTAESGIGAVVGYGVASLEVANMLKLWGEATGTMQTVYGVVQLACGAILSQIEDLDSNPLPELPDSKGYDHPLVTR